MGGNGNLPSLNININIKNSHVYDLLICGLSLGVTEEDVKNLFSCNPTSEVCWYPNVFFDMGEMAFSVAKQLKSHLHENDAHCLRIKKLISSVTTGRQAKETL